MNCGCFCTCSPFNTASVHCSVVLHMLPAGVRANYPQSDRAIHYDRRSESCFLHMIPAIYPRELSTITWSYPHKIATYPHPYVERATQMVSISMLGCHLRNRQCSANRPNPCEGCTARAALPNEQYNSCSISTRVIFVVAFVVVEIKCVNEIAEER
jgi:hypothetical protein